MLKFCQPRRYLKVFQSSRAMSLIPDVDPDGLLEYSVVFTDRAVNHMSKKFQKVMNEISTTLKSAYNAKSAVVIPGSGSFGMESVARQFGTGKKCMVLRNGWFSYRWTQIFEMGNIPSESRVLKARRVENTTGAPANTVPFMPPPLDEVLTNISEFKPDVFFMPHVETSAGILLPDDYIKTIATAVHAVGGMVVLDCIASGALWVDMKTTGVDVIISAPQKGWSGSPCSAFVMLSESARTLLDSTNSTSFAMDLKKWCSIMEAYEAGGHGYHTTMPTDALITTNKAMLEAKEFGFERLRDEQVAMGNAIRKACVDRGFVSVAAEGYQSPTVVVSYTSNPELKSGKCMAGIGVQIAAGVPLQCDEGADFSTFRLGLFGLEKCHNLERTVASLEDAFKKALP